MAYIDKICVENHRLPQKKFLSDIFRIIMRQFYMEILWGLLCQSHYQPF